MTTTRLRPGDRAAGDRAIRARQRATRLAFFIAGFGMAAWAPMVPYAQARLGIDAGRLGALLLCLGIGSIVTMPLAGSLAARRGCRAVIAGSALAMLAALPVLAGGTHLAWLAAALLVFGGGVGALDVAINIQAIAVERDSLRPMMSGFHGLFSLGGIAGAAGTAGLLAAGASPLAASLAVDLGIAAALGLAWPALATRPAAEPGPAFALPRGIVLGVGALCFIMFLTEGAVLDWSAVFLSSVRGLDPAYAGLGYACFALAMTIGRLAGDRITSRLGPARVLLGGGLCAAFGLAVAAAVDHWAAGLAGMALVGIGCSNIVPVLFSAAGRQTRMPESLAVPAIATMGYAGILIGPAAIGFVARATSLADALLLVAVLLVGVALSHRAVGR